MFPFSVTWGDGEEELLNLTLVEQTEEKPNKTPLLIEVEEQEGEEHNGRDRSNFEGPTGKAVATILQLIALAKPPLYPEKPNCHRIKFEH